MNRRLQRFLGLLWVIYTSCGGSAALESREPNLVQTKLNEAVAPAPVSSGVAARAPAQKKQRPTDAFIVHAEGRIELRSLGETAIEVLAEDASDLALYDPVLELIWYTQEEQLFVIDLRETEPARTLIASSIPDVSRLEILQANRSVRIQETCEGPTLSLHWNEHPSVDAYDGDISQTRIDGSSWLQAQKARPARVVGATRSFEEGKRVRLPRGLLDCEIPEVCAASVPFGVGDLQLVLVLDKSGGDCWNRGCLLRDPQTNRYASPVDRDGWGRAEKTKRGPCGLYFFNQQKTAFLVGTRLCLVETGCTELGGAALGWLNPGDTVGAVGSPDDELE